MQSLLVIIDGLGDDLIPDLGYKTPFQAAEHKNIDKLIELGTFNEFSISENDFIPESLSCILRLLGVPQKYFPSNRAYLELLAHDKDISEYEMVLRCNLIAVDDNNKLVAFNGQGLSSQEMLEVAEICNTHWQGIEFMHLSAYRNLLILDKDKPILNECIIKPPHESLGENVNCLLADLKSKSLRLKTFMYETELLLSKFKKNNLRYMLYPWGPSERTVIPTFSQIHMLKGASVCEAEIVKGISKALKLHSPKIENATGDIDTDINAKLIETLHLLENNDFVLTHFNGSDEAAHRYDYLSKKDFITKIDRVFLKNILENYKKPLKIIICGDHVTSSISGKHTAGKVPVIAARINYSMNNLIIEKYQDITNFLYGSE